MDRLLFITILIFLLFTLSIVQASSDPIFNESFDSLDLIEENGGTGENIVLDPGLLRRALLMQGPTDNLLDNPSFETTNTLIEGFREWKKYVGSCGLENLSFIEETGTVYQGNRSAKIQYGCAYGTAYVSQVMGSSGRGNEARPAPAATYKFKVYAKGTGTIIVGIQNGSAVNTSVYSLDNSWKQYNASYSINSTVHLEPYLSFSDGATAWIDSAELTYNVFPNLSYPLLEGFPDEGTIEFWLKPKWDGNESNKTHVFLSTNSLGPDGWGEFVIGKWWNKSAITFKIFQWTSAEINTSSWVANEWYHIAFTWSEGTARSYVDGILASSGAYTPGAFSSTRFYLGSSSLSTNHSDALMDAFKIYDYAKTYGTEILPTRCGDGIWDIGENLTNCPEDCNEYCIEPPLDIDVLQTGDYTLATYVMPGWHDTTMINFNPDWEEEYDFTAWDEWMPEIETEPIHPDSDHPKEPLINYYDSNNPIAVDHMIKFGLEHGISLYIYNWYWYKGHEFLGAPMNTFMESKYLTKYPDKINFAVMFDTPYNYSYAGGQQDLLDAMEYNLQHYLNHSNYYKIGNKPVFFVYSVPHITQALGDQGTIDLFAEWDQMAKNAGHDGLVLISLNHWGNLAGCGNTSLGFQGDTYYAYLGDYWNYSTYEGIPYTTYENWTLKHEDYWELLYDCPGSYVFPSIAPGWDNTPSPIQQLGIVAVVNSTPEKYGLMAQKAKDYVDEKNLSPKIIITEAWDEWKEGAAVAPTKKWGTGYLEALAETFGETTEFIPPTEDNATYINRTWAQVNITMDESSLDTFIFNWNTTNYTIYDDSLILALNFNNNSEIGENNTHFVDISKYGNNGTCSGSTCPTYTTSGKFGGAFSFEGDDYINCSNSSSLNSNSYSFEAWVKAADSGDDMIASKGTYSNHGWYLVRYGDYLHLVLSNSTNASDMWSNATYIVQDEFVHIVVQWNQTNYTFYKNGALDKSGAIDIAWTNSSKDLVIGDYSIPGSWNFNGTLDEIRIYNKVLSADEIWLHYQTNFQKHNSTRHLFYSNLTSLTEGTYTYFGWANDTLGNGAYTIDYTQTNPRYLYVDTTPPQISFVNLTTTTGTHNQDYIEANVTVTETSQFNVTIALYNGAGSLINSSTSSSSPLYINFTNLADGTYYLNATANDSAGNTNHTEIRTIILDTTGPVLNFTSPTEDNATYINRTWAQVNITMDESSLDTFIFNWNTTNYTIYDDSLILALNFNNNSDLGENDSYAVDISKYGNDGIYSGTSNWTIHGRYGGAYEFDGSDEYSNYFALGEDYSILPKNKITVEAWIKTNYRGPIINNYFEAGLYHWGYSLEVSEENLEFIIGSNSSKNTVFGTFNISDGNWHHIVGTFNGTSLKIFIDGVLNGTEYYIGNISYYPYGRETYLGFYITQVLAKSHFNGTIDEVRIYNRPLSADEIWLHYQTEFQKYNFTRYLFYSNITNLTDGTYTYFGWANDTLGNQKSTKTKTIKIDTIPPTISSFVLSDNSVYVGDTITGACTATDNIKGVFSGVVTGIDTSTAGTRNATCTATDYAGNQVISKLEYTIIKKSSEGGGGGSSPSYESEFWVVTRKITKEDFDSGFSTRLENRYRVELQIENEYHHVGVINLTENLAIVNVSSEPQQAIFYPNDEKRFEVTGDDYYDIYVKLNSINYPQANFTIKEIHEFKFINFNNSTQREDKPEVFENGSETKGSEDKTEFKNPEAPEENLYLFLFVLFSLVTLLLSLLILRHLKKKEIERLLKSYDLKKEELLKRNNSTEKS